MNSTLSHIVSRFALSLVPPPELTIDEWAERHRIVPEGTTSEPGLWRNTRFPFLVEIMKELSPQSPARTVVVMKGSQLGFTELAINLMFYVIDHDPCPLLYVQKTLQTVERFSKQRFQKSIEASEGVKEKIGDLKSRDSSNTMTLKNFAGGIIILGGANSAASLRSMPIQILVLDEEDSFEEDIQDEGTPSELAIRRTANFPRRKIYHLSTPKIKETSKIEPLFLEGDQRRYYVPCPFCGFMQLIHWSRIIYKDDDGKDDLDHVYLRCESCKSKIYERYKTQMLERGEWRKANPGAEIASFHLSALYSPLGFYSWKTAAEDWIRAERTFNKQKLKVFINTVLGETFQESGKSVESGWLSKRKETYQKPVPKDGLILVAGADVQEDRIECEIVAFGKNEENWSIDYAVFRGDTEYNTVWGLLDDYLLRTWEHESGVEMNVACACIDAGYRTKIACAFCRTREFRRIFPVIGRPGWGKGYVKRPRTRNEEHRVYLFTVWVDEVKSKIYSQLKVDEKGPAYCHFPRRGIYDSNYFRMLTAERMVTKRHLGHNVLQWELPEGRRNEALDCRVYAVGALTILNPNFDVIAERGPVVVRNRAIKRRRRRVHSRGL